jgi:hypothetical protein
MSAVGRADANGGSGSAAEVHKSAPAKSPPAKPPGSGSAASPSQNSGSPPASTEPGEKIQGPTCPITREQLKLEYINRSLNNLVAVEVVNATEKFNLRSDDTTDLIAQINFEVARLVPRGPGFTAGAARVSELIVEQYSGNRQRQTLIREAVRAAQEIRTRDNLRFSNDVEGADQPVAATTTGRGSAATVPAQPGEKAKGAQVSGNRAQTALLQPAAIDKGLTQLNAAMHERDVALQRENKEHFSQTSLDAYQAANDKVSKAQSELGVAVKQETDRLSRPSVISPEVRNADDVRTVEARIVAAVPAGQKAYVSKIIRDNQRARLPIGMGALSEKVNAYIGELAPESSEEGKAIIEDVFDWVTVPRADDGSSRKEIRANQFERLSDFVKSTLENPKFNKVLGEYVITQCVKVEMDISGKEDFKTLKGIVGNLDYPALHGWINANLPLEFEVKKR